MSYKQTVNFFYWKAGTLWVASGVEKVLAGDKWPSSSFLETNHSVKWRKEITATHSKTIYSLCTDSTLTRMHLLCVCFCYHYKTSRLKTKAFTKLWLPYPHWMDVSIRGFPFCHLYGSDAQGPDVSHTVVTDFLNYLRSHPEWGSYYSIAFCHCILQRYCISVSTRQKHKANRYSNIFIKTCDQLLTQIKKLTTSLMLQISHSMTYFRNKSNEINVVSLS